MAAVVTQDGSIRCATNGVATLTSPAKLTVGGQAVLLFSGVSSFAPLAGCTFVTPGGTKQPCTTLSALSGRSTKLTAGSQAVLLGSASVQSNNAAADPVTVSAGQTKVTAS